MWSLDGDKKNRDLNHPIAKPALYVAHRAPNNTSPAWKNCF